MYVKLLCDDLNHNGFQYQEGLNICPDFNFDEYNHGFFFAKQEDIHKWFGIQPNLHWIVDVELLPDSQVVHMDDKLKTDKFILKNKRPISEELKQLAVQFNAWVIQFIKDPSEVLKQLAVQEDGFSIQLFKDPSEELQKLAVQENGLSIQFIENPSYQVQKLALQENGRSINYIYITNLAEDLKQLYYTFYDDN